MTARSEWRVFVEFTSSESRQDFRIGVQSPQVLTTYATGKHNADEPLWNRNNLPVLAFPHRLSFERTQNTCHDEIAAGL